MMRSLFITIAIFTGSLFLGVGGAHALTISPPTAALTVKPGATASTTLRLFNETAQPLRLSAVLEPWGPDGVGNPPVGAADAAAARQVLGWLAVHPRELRLDPGAIAEVRLSAAVPRRAAVGGHYASVLFESVATPEAAATVGVRSRVGALVFLTVPGAAESRLELISFTLEPPSPWRSSLPLTAQAVVHNAGTVHGAPSGEVAVVNALGLTVATLPLNPTRRLLLPDETRTFGVTWAKARRFWPTPWLGFWPRLQAEAEEFGFGRYRLVLRLEGTSTPAVVGAWVLPVRLLLVAVILLLVISWLIGRRRHRGVARVPT